MTTSELSATFVRADTPLQAEMARAIIALVRVIEEDAARSRRLTTRAMFNGRYSLKLTGKRISPSYERIFEELIQGTD